ncbi:MAG: hypothetical protein ACOC6S_02485 [Chloroflexota bacterium]
MKDTREQVKSLKLEHPELTLSEIGSQVGKTPQRVRQILMEHGLPTKAVRPERSKRHCLNCGKELPNPNSKFCSRACFNDYRLVTLECICCGRQFRRCKSRVNNHEHAFCSKTCQGIWFAKRYGLGTRLTRKLDYERIRQLYDEGHSGKEIASLTGEKPGSIYRAIYRMELRFRSPTNGKSCSRDYRKDSEARIEQSVTGDGLACRV